MCLRAYAGELGFALPHEFGHWLVGAAQGLSPEIVSTTFCTVSALTPEFLLGGWLFETFLFLGLTQVAAAVGRPMRIGFWFGMIIPPAMRWNGCSDQAKLIQISGMDGNGWFVVILIALSFAVAGVVYRFQHPITELEGKKGGKLCST